MKNFLFKYIPIFIFLIFNLLKINFLIKNYNLFYNILYILNILLIFFYLKYKKIIILIFLINFIELLLNNLFKLFDTDLLFKLFLLSIILVDYIYTL